MAKKSTRRKTTASSSGSLRRFELVDEKSNKFWEVSTSDSVFTIRFGRIGTEGQTKHKDVGSPDKAVTEVEKLIRTKTKKGYVESPDETKDTGHTGKKAAANKKAKKESAASVLSAKLEETIERDFQACEELLRSGEGRNEWIEKNCKRLASWQEAAEAGDARGQVLYGSCYYDGHGVRNNLKKAVEWFTKSAKQGNANGQVSLGNCYYDGHGVRKNIKKAVVWFRKSAEQGNACAQSVLGICYLHGDGVRKDHKKAVEWFRMAANQGNAEGQCNLGSCYYHGHGVRQDYQKVADWLREAADYIVHGFNTKLEQLERFGIGFAEGVDPLSFLRKRIETERCDWFDDPADVNDWGMFLLELGGLSQNAIVFADSDYHDEHPALIGIYTVILESIYDEADEYSKIVRGLNCAARNRFALEAVRDSIDWDSGECELAFELDDTVHRFSCEQTDDFVSVDIVGPVIKLLQTSNPAIRFADSGDPAVVIAIEDPSRDGQQERLDEFNLITDQSFEWCDKHWRRHRPPGVPGRRRG